MELYELNLHFPDTYESLGHEGITLNSVEYYESAEKAINRAIEVASAFATPKPDYFYLENATGRVIWTDYPEEVKRDMQYDLLGHKPIIKPMTNKDNE